MNNELINCADKISSKYFKYMYLPAFLMIGMWTFPIAHLKIAGKPKEGTNGKMYFSKST